MGGRRACVVLDGITQMCQSPKKKPKKCNSLSPAVVKQPADVKADGAEDITEAGGVYVTQPGIKT